MSKTKFSESIMLKLLSLGLFKKAEGMVRITSLKSRVYFHSKNIYLKFLYTLFAIQFKRNLEFWF